MKIEIDLNDILGDEHGSETLQESVRRQVLETLSKTILQQTQKQIAEETSRILNETLQAALVDRMPALVEEVINGEYVPVDRFGSKAPPTTFRAELLKSITEQMVYKKTTYSSDATVFTKAVDSVVAAKMAEFQKAFHKEIDTHFMHDAYLYAQTKLAERLGIKMK